MKDFRYKRYKDSDGNCVELFMNYTDEPCVHVNDDRYVVLSADAIRGMRKWLKKALRNIEEDQAQDAQRANNLSFTDFMNDTVHFECIHGDSVWVMTDKGVNVKLDADNVDTLIDWLKEKRKSM